MLWVLLGWTAYADGFLLHVLMRGGRWRVEGIKGPVQQRYLFRWSCSVAGNGCIYGEPDHSTRMVGRGIVDGRQKLKNGTFVSSENKRARSRNGKEGYCGV